MMKRFLKCAMEWTTAACLGFTGTMVVYAAIAAIMGERVIGLRAILSMLLLVAVGTFIQYLCFTENIIRDMRYTRRLLLFGALFMPVLTAIGACFGWFPVQKAGAWLLFLGIALAVFALMTLGFELYYRAAGKKYDGLLGQYRREHGDG